MVKKKKEAKLEAPKKTTENPPRSFTIMEEQGDLIVPAKNQTPLEERKTTKEEVHS